MTTGSAVPLLVIRLLKSENLSVKVAITNKDEAKNLVYVLVNTVTLKKPLSKKPHQNTTGKAEKLFICIFTNFLVYVTLETSKWS
jgi:hypothetical protein